MTGPPIGQALGFVLGPYLVGHPATANSGLAKVRRLMWLEAAPGWNSKWSQSLGRKQVKSIEMS